jgi:lysozyme
VKTSALGLELIASHEGFVRTVYQDITGADTIGYGHLLKPGEAFPNGVTPDEALVLLAQDVGVAEGWVSKVVKVALAQNQFDALVSFVFNLGGYSLEASTLLYLLNASNYVGAAKQFLRWCHARVRGQYVVVAGLYERRLDEACLFLGGDRSEALRTLGLTAGT